jgi:hypothetical protein
VLKERFGLRVTPEAIRQHLISMGYRWKRTRYVPCQPPETSRKSKKSQKRASGAKKGALKGEIVLKYLDESGISLCLHLPATPGRIRAKSTSIR